MHFVYIIHSLTHDVLYKGYSENPQERLLQHNSGKSEYTTGRGPWELVFLKSFDSRTEALKFEKMLKRQNRNYLNWLISSPRNELP